jgi:hypothetical protein
MTVPPPTRDELAPVPDDGSFDESFWRGYAIDVLDYREEWVDELITDRGVSGLVAELGAPLDD